MRFFFVVAFLSLLTVSQASRQRYRHEKACNRLQIQQGRTQGVQSLFVGTDLAPSEKSEISPLPFIAILFRKIFKLNIVVFFCLLVYSLDRNQGNFKTSSAHLVIASIEACLNSYYEVDGRIISIAEGRLEVLFLHLAIRIMATLGGGYIDFLTLFSLDVLIYWAFELHQQYIAIKN